MVRTSDNSYVRLAIALVLVICVYQFILTPDQKNSINSALKSIERLKPAETTRGTLPTLGTAPTRSALATAIVAPPKVPAPAGLADCATVTNTTTPCEWKNGTPTTVPAPTATPYRGEKPQIWIDPELIDATPIPVEPVLEVAPLPVSNVLSTTADYRSDCHAMFMSKEDKSGWADDIAACERTGDYK